MKCTPKSIFTNIECRKIYYDALVDFKRRVTHMAADFSRQHVDSVMFWTCVVLIALILGFICYKIYNCCFRKQANLTPNVVFIRDVGRTGSNVGLLESRAGSQFFDIESQITSSEYVRF